jgi:hypothetical protein
MKSALSSKEVETLPTCETAAAVARDLSSAAYWMICAGTRVSSGTAAINRRRGAAYEVATVKVSAGEGLAGRLGFLLCEELYESEASVASAGLRGQPDLLNLAVRGEQFHQLLFRRFERHILDQQLATRLREGVNARFW